MTNYYTLLLGLKYKYFPSYTMFFYFLSLKNKIIGFIPTPYNSRFPTES